MTIREFVSVGIIFMLSACVTGPADMERSSGVLAQHPPAEYEKVMNRFVESAVKGDVDTMLALTSPITIQRMGGEAAVRKNYLEDKIVLFQSYPRMDGSREVHFLPARAGSVGWRINKVFRSTDGQTERVAVTVLEEAGQIRVAGIGPWR